MTQKCLEFFLQVLHVGKADQPTAPLPILTAILVACVGYKNQTLKSLLGCTNLQLTSTAAEGCFKHKVGLDEPQKSLSANNLQLLEK